MVNLDGVNIHLKNSSFAWLLFSLAKETLTLPQLLFSELLVGVGDFYVSVDSETCLVFPETDYEATQQRLYVFCLSIHLLSFP